MKIDLLDIIKPKKEENLTNTEIEKMLVIENASENTRGAPTGKLTETYWGSYVN